MYSHYLHASSGLISTLVNNVISAPSDFFIDNEAFSANVTDGLGHSTYQHPKQVARLRGESGSHPLPHTAAEEAETGERDA